MDTLETIRSIIVDCMGLDADQITPESELIEDLGCDSLDLVQIVMAVEEEMGVEISNEDLETITTVADAVDAAERARLPA